MENKGSGTEDRVSGTGAKPETGYQALRGMKDMLPGEAEQWHEVERTVAEVARLYGYGEIRTPSLEQARLFNRSVGEETDIVSKEMYLFTDKGGEEVALRAELTAPVVRAAIEHHLITGQSDCVRLYYNSARNFRYEKPQLGRLRQHHQFGTELLGPASPRADAETISFAISIFRKLGLSNFKVRLNSLASPAAREEWKRVLVPYLKQNIGKLSNESQRRTETNPMRVLDSKSPEDQEIIRKAPVILEYLSTEDREHFETLQAALTTEGIHFAIDPLLVRGLDYYTRTVFEVTSSDLGSQDALCGGGRYDNLIETLGGPPTPAVGFGAGVERLLIALQKVRGERAAEAKNAVLVIAQSPMTRMKCYEITSQLRVVGLSASSDLNDRSMKAQMREANRVTAAYAYIIGESEIESGAGMLKNMKTGEQESVSFGEIANRLRELQSAPSPNS